MTWELGGKMRSNHATSDFQVRKSEKDARVSELEFRVRWPFQTSFPSQNKFFSEVLVVFNTLTLEIRDCRVTSCLSMPLETWPQECPSELFPDNLIIHVSTISHLQRCFREFVTTSNRPHNRRPCVTTPYQGSTSGFFTCGIVWDQPPRQLMKIAFYKWKCT